MDEVLVIKVSSRLKRGIKIFGVVAAVIFGGAVALVYVYGNPEDAQVFGLAVLGFGAFALLITIPKLGPVKVDPNRRKVYKAGIGYPWDEFKGVAIVEVENAPFRREVHSGAYSHVIDDTMGTTLVVRLIFGNDRDFELYQTSNVREARETARRVAGLMDLPLDDETAAERV